MGHQKEVRIELDIEVEELVYYKDDTLQKEKGRIALDAATLIDCSNKPCIFAVKDSQGPVGVWQVETGKKLTGEGDRGLM